MTDILRKVRKAQSITTDILAQSGLTSAQRKSLDDLSDILRGIDNALLLELLDNN